MALALSGAAPVQPASAQGLLDVLFGNFHQRRAPLPPRVSAYSDPFGFGDERRSAGRRLLQLWRPFSWRPLVRLLRAHLRRQVFSGEEQRQHDRDRALQVVLPRSRTKVFAGSKIDYSVAPDGTRYADLDSAFLYRERTVDNCTCNGKTAGGLASLKPELDPTLRPGDIVATNEGLVTFNGNRRAKTAEFTPIDKSGGSSEWKLRLMSIKVAPAPEAEEPVKPVEEEKKAERTDRRRAQR